MSASDTSSPSLSSSASPEAARQVDEMRRRALLQSAAGLALAGAAPGSPAAAPPLVAATLLGRTPGKPGDFDFLAGHWQINHRRLLGQTSAAANQQWDEFPGEASCWSILGGVGSVEELRIPARGFAGLGLRLLDLQQQRWFDFWVNARSGVLTPPGMPGSFEGGEGLFFADETDEQGRTMQVRGVWDRITPNACRWHQALSHDGGRSWEVNWLMDWRRV